MNRKTNEIKGLSDHPYASARSPTVTFDNENKSTPEVTPLGISVTAFEPAGMKTDFAKDSSLTVYPSGPAYAETAGAIGAWLKSPGYGEDYADPDDIAAILMKVSDSPTPPVRLLVSASSFELAKAAEQARIESDERWKELSLQA